MTIAINAILYTRVIKTTITLTITPKDVLLNVLNILIVSRIVVDVVPLVYTRFAAGIAIVYRNTYYKNKIEKRTILNTEITINS